VCHQATNPPARQVCHQAPNLATKVCHHQAQCLNPTARRAPPPPRHFPTACVCIASIHIRNGATTGQIRNRDPRPRLSSIISLSTISLSAITTTIIIIIPRPRPAEQPPARHSGQQHARSSKCSAEEHHTPWEGSGLRLHREGGVEKPMGREKKWRKQKKNGKKKGRKSAVALNKFFVFFVEGFFWDDHFLKKKNWRMRQTSQTKILY
jgi:hypothetical protein